MSEDKKLPSLIKWTGSKRHLANEIKEYIPKNIEVYYEPFVGGGSMFFSILNDERFNVKKYVLSDINSDLISLWNVIIKEHEKLKEEYNFLWNEFNKSDENNLIQHRKDYFQKIKKEFNKTRNPFIFFFLTRTSINGLIRYNQKNQYNSSCHFSRPGMNPETINKIIDLWHNKLISVDITFNNDSYEYIKETNSNDVLYLDPPYANSGAMYYGKIDYDKFWEWIRIQKAKTLLSFDGETTAKQYSIIVPKDLYYKHIKNEKKNSSFNNLNLKEVKVKESLFLIN